MYRLTDSFPYLVNRVGVRVGEVFAQRLQAHGVTLPMYRVMAALRERTGQRLGDLAEATSVEVSTLSRLVGIMVERGLVSRERPAEDGRAVVIDLTPRGQEVVRGLIPLAERHEAVALRGFTEAEAARVKRDLVRVFENLRAAEEGEARPEG